MEKDLKKIIIVGTNGRSYEAMELLKAKPLEENVFEELNDLTEHELDRLLRICDVRFYNELPIDALTANEKRMAYCVWKADIEKEKMEPTKTFAKNALRLIKFCKSFLERGTL